MRRHLISGVLAASLGMAALAALFLPSRNAATQVLALQWRPAAELAALFFLVAMTALAAPRPRRPAGCERRRCRPGRRPGRNGVRAGRTATARHWARPRYRPARRSTRTKLAEAGGRRRPAADSPRRAGPPEQRSRRAETA